MIEVKKIIDDMGIASFENNMKIASFAVLSDLRDIVYQTENWDLSEYKDLFFRAFKGAQSIELNNVEFLVTRVSDEGLIGTNPGGMGHVIAILFQGGILVAYVLSGGNPNDVIAFLKPYIMKLNNLL